MYETNYQRAKTASEAVKLIKAADDGKFVAGGQTLIPTMKARLAAPSDLVDLRHIGDLSGIKVSGKNVSIGAGATHAEVAGNAKLAKVCPAFVALAGNIGDPHVRAMGTIGGSVANNDPAADYPAAMLALGATIVTNRRKISADRFFKGLFETALGDDELIKEITFTAPAKAGYAKFPNPASRYAMTGVFVARNKEGVRVAVTGAGEDGVFRAKKMEKALDAKFDAGSLDGISVPADGLMGDIHGSPEYRANLVSVMAKRAVAAAG